MRVHHISDETIRSRGWQLRLFVAWCEKRGLTRPAEIAKSAQLYTHLAVGNLNEVHVPPAPAAEVRFHAEGVALWTVNDGGSTLFVPGLPPLGIPRGRGPARTTGNARPGNRPPLRDIPPGTFPISRRFAQEICTLAGDLPEATVCAGKASEHFPAMGAMFSFRSKPVSGIPNLTATSSAWHQEFTGLASGAELQSGERAKDGPRCDAGWGAIGTFAEKASRTPRER